ncbi:hypothetical protein [Anaerococcus provencensis]|uniref:hypothetical protein n=1 Tax=Anaerococcus provencensis TaxID=938293 RepID=UPI0003033C5D|nr:hypothetical protein [Anaerococcus provencensis]
MNIKKTILSLLVILSFAFVSSCDLNKDDILGSYNNIVESAGKIELTPKFKLKGEKSGGADDLRGVYTSDYENFTGEECIFGTTSIQTSEDLSIKCNIISESGDAKVILSKDDNDEETILEGNGSIEENLNLSAGRNYIIIKCDNFTGNIEIETE